MIRDLDSDPSPLSDEELVRPANDRVSELDHREAAFVNDCRTGAGIAEAARAHVSQQQSSLCPKCNSPMEQGYVVDMSHAARFVSSWARGAPQQSWILNTRLPKETLPIGAFRCSSCGYVESYAREEFAAENRKLQFKLRSLLIFVTVVALVLGIIAWANQF
jgi:hypothetical protein